VSASAETAEERETNDDGGNERNERRFAIETHLEKKHADEEEVSSRILARVYHTSYRTLYRYIAQQAARVFAPLTFSSCSSFSSSPWTA
jgi:hypothetical protein